MVQISAACSDIVVGITSRPLLLLPLLLLLLALLLLLPSPVPGLVTFALFWTRSGVLLLLTLFLSMLDCSQKFHQFAIFPPTSAAQLMIQTQTCAKGWGSSQYLGNRAHRHFQTYFSQLFSKNNCIL